MKILKSLRLKIRLLVAGFLLATGVLLPVCASSFADGVNLYNQGKYSQALPILESAVRASPYDANGHYYLALCYQGLKQGTVARQHFDWVAKNSRDPRLQAYAASALGASSGTVSTASVAVANPGINEVAKTAMAKPVNAVRNNGRCKVMMFETSWCHYCHEFAPEFDAAGSQYRNMDFQRLDAEAPENVGLAQKYDIHSFPRLVYLDGKGELLYNEGRGQFANRLTELSGH